MLVKTKLSLTKILDAINSRNSDFYKNLPECEQKQVNTYILMRYLSNPSVSEEIYNWFLEQTNCRLNKNFWQLNKKHPELCWRLASSIGVDMPVKYTYSASTTKTKNSQIENTIMEYYPTMKIQDIKTWINLMTEQEKKELMSSLALTPKNKND
jgi:hypothetical protein